MTKDQWENSLVTLLLMQDASSLEPFGKEQKVWHNPKYGLVKSCGGSWNVRVVWWKTKAPF